MKMRRTASRAHPSNPQRTPFFSKSTNQNGRTEPRPFFQPKLEIGAPGDRFEREADTVADQVVAQGAAPQVQRMRSGCAEEAQREPEVRRQPLEEEEELLQPKADPELRRQPLEEEEELLQPKADPELQRQPLEEEEEELQAKAEPGQAATAGPELESRLRTTRGSGQPLPSPILGDMNAAFGLDFGGVRVHTGGPAAQMSRDLKAQAFTHGRDIYFNQGKFVPQSNPGRRLLAHELTHVVQQGSAGLAAGPGRIQRDLVLPPQGSGVQRVLSRAEIRSAIRYNRRKFRRRSSFRVIRDVIGIPPSPARSDRALAMATLRWQADHGLAQDGKIGVVTLMFILEELQAEGQTRAARALRRDFRGSTGRRGRRLPDINASHCGCRAGIRNQIAHFQRAIATYQMCRSFPWIRTRAQVANCVWRDFNPGGSFSGGESTFTWSGVCRIRVDRAPGPCGPLHEQITRNHEVVHCVTAQELRKQHTSRAAFETTRDTARYEADDEIGAYRADIAVARWMLRVLDRLCAAGGAGRGGGARRGGSP